MKIGWIGTGVMGVSMAGRLMDAGHTCVVYNRTKSKAQPLLDRGATWLASPKEVAQKCKFIFTIVGFPEDVREVYFGQLGILQGSRKGQVLVDMTTTEPSLAVEIYEAALSKGASAIDAPVSGGDVGAKKGDPFNYDRRGGPGH